MPLPDETDHLLTKIRQVVERIHGHAERGLQAHALPPAAQYELQNILEAAGYAASEIESFQGAVSTKWKCTGCGTVQTTIRSVRKKALSACKTCGRKEFAAVPS